MSDKFLNFFRNIFSTKTIKINNFTFLQNKAIQCVLTNICIFIKVYDISPILYFLGKLSLEKAPLNLGSFWQCFWISKFIKGWGGIKNPILFHNQLLQFLFYSQNQLLQFLSLIINFLARFILECLLVFLKVFLLVFLFHC